MELLKKTDRQRRAPRPGDAVNTLGKDSEIWCQRRGGHSAKQMPDGTDDNAAAEPLHVRGSTFAVRT